MPFLPLPQIGLGMRLPWTRLYTMNLEPSCLVVASEPVVPPNNGQKSNTTKVLKNRYKDATPQVFLNTLPDSWVPGSVIVEGMFNLNTTPLGSHRTFADYAHFLAKRFLLPHFSRGCIEVHLIFDNPGRLPQTPKYFERKRRDLSATVMVGHVCDEITASRRIPSK